MTLAVLVGASIAALALPLAPARAAGPYAWRESPVPPGETLQARIAPPPGFRRVSVPEGSFAAWLRGLPLLPAGAKVHLFDGRLKARQDVHVAVINIDTGKRDLQQCADAVMRLRAEYLYAAGRRDEIGFDYTGGAKGARHVPFSRWAKGWRPIPTRRGVRWRKRGRADAGYASFRRYLVQVFAYAGTYSLARELRPVPVDDMRIGDVFIEGGFPGHAVLVADMVENPSTGERRFLLVQSFMPAQQMHVLRNPGDGQASPWYRLPRGMPLITPEWVFPAGSLKRFP